MSRRTTPLRALSALFSVLALTGCALGQQQTGLTEDGLKPCPDAPRCVSSQAVAPEKRIPPFTVNGEADNLWQRVGETVQAMERTTVVKRSDSYLHAEVVSPWRVYTDDLELLLDHKAGLIHVRSSARIGYYDFNVNRDRVEALRKNLRKAGLIEAGTEQDQ